MDLGAFSISLAVKDIEKSKVFYQKLGFKEVGGDISQNWLILRNGDHTIGLFQGMFDKNILTFNPLGIVKPMIWIRSQIFAFYNVALKIKAWNLPARLMKIPPVQPVSCSMILMEIRSW